MNQLPARSVPGCPSDEQLRHLLLGDLNESERAALETHVDLCQPCQELVASLCECPEALTWREAIREKEPLDGPEIAFLERLKAQMPPGSPAIVFPGPWTDRAPLGRLDSYEVIRELGQGGMGVVFLARDSHLDSLVTLKVLKPELAAIPQDRERFFREGRAAAAVKHDHVVPVHRAATSSEFPLPYLVMEYIDGQSLDRRLEQQGGLSPRESAQIACQVARGLAAAHDAGLVHRDVKPSNIMLQAGTGRARITDFGLARVLDAKTEPLTRYGGTVGTPAYMSPEHVLAPEEVDARSDIYSLGAVLYEMLTGERAFAGTPHMVLNQTVHDDPRPPCKLDDAVPRDLETICLKCLRKAPADRYASASLLADDLQRFLKGEPIEARPVGRWERLVMWCRRNPKTALLASGIAALLLLVTAISVTSAVIIRNSWKKETAARARADRRSAQARAAVDEMYTQVAEEWLADQPFMQRLQRQFLLKALYFYQELAEENVADPEIQRETAVAQRRVGDIHFTLGAYEEAHAAYQQATAVLQELVDHGHQPQDQEELAISHLNRALLCTTWSRTEEAQKAYGSARLLLEPLVAEFPDVPQYSEHLANCFSSLSELYRETGKSADGVACCRRAIQLQKTLVRRSPGVERYRRDLATSQVHLGLALEQLGNFDEAVREIKEGIARQEALVTQSPAKPGYRSDQANSYSHLSRLQQKTGQLAEARETLLHVKELQQRMVAEFPGVPRNRTELGSTLAALAGLMRDLGQLDDAEAYYRQAIDVYAGLAREFPEVPDHQMHVAGITSNLCGLLAKTGRSDEARAACVEVIGEQERLLDRFPDNINYQVALAISCNNFGNMLEGLGQIEEAENLLRRAVRIYSQLAQRLPDAITLRNNRNGSISNLSRILVNNGKRNEAEMAFQEAIENQKRLATEHPDIPDYESDLAQTYTNLGILLTDLGRLSEAEDAYRDALVIRDALSRKYAGVLQFRRDAAASHNNLGVFLDSTGQREKAREPLEYALQIREELAEDHADDLQLQIDLCGSYGNMGRHFRLSGDVQAALPWFDKCIRLIREALEQEPDQREARRVLRNALGSRTLVLDSIGRYEDALDDLDSALALTQEPAKVCQLSVHRAFVLLHLERYEEAIRQAETAASSPAIDAGQRYDLACVLSLLSAAFDNSPAATSGQSERVDQLQRRAVQELERCRESGFFARSGAVEHLEKDADLDPVRARGDFQKLLAALSSEPDSGE